MQSLLVHLLSRLDHYSKQTGFRSPRQFAETLRLTRFAALFPATGLDALRRSAAAGGGAGGGGLCASQNASRVAEIRKLMPKKKIVSAAKTLVELLNVAELTDTGILDVWLGDYVEELVRWATGSSSEAVSDFLQDCLDVDGLPVGTLEKQDAHAVPGPDVIRLTPVDEYTGEIS